MEVEKKLNGLGGWLTLVGLGIIISPFSLGAWIFSMYSDVFSNGSFYILTTPGTDAYNILWMPLLIGEMLINIILVAAWLFIGFLFFSKKINFPKWYIGILIFSLVFIVLDAFAIKLVLPDEPIFDPDTIKEFSKNLLSALIWIPYMLMSKRVKLTFVKN